MPLIAMLSKQFFFEDFGNSCTTSHIGALNIKHLLIHCKISDIIFVVVESNIESLILRGATLASYILQMELAVNIRTVNPTREKNLKGFYYILMTSM